MCEQKKTRTFFKIQNTYNTKPVTNNNNKRQLTKVREDNKAESENGEHESLGRLEEFVSWKQNSLSLIT